MGGRGDAKEGSATINHCVSLIIEKVTGKSYLQMKINIKIGFYDMNRKTSKRRFRARLQFYSLKRKTPGTHDNYAYKLVLHKINFFNLVTESGCSLNPL